MLLFKKLLVLVVSLLLYSNVFGQSDTITSFNRYYLKSVDKLRDLYAVRGASFICEDMNDPYKEVTQMLNGYGTLKNRLGILFYSYNEDSLRTWLLHKDRLVYHVASIKKEELIKAEVDLRQALKVDLLLASRNAKNRGVTIKKKDSLQRPGIDESIKIATDYLFPEHIRNNLSGIKHLIVIPEFNISQFPLYMLKPFSNGYLIDSASVSIAPHLCNLAMPMKEYRNYIGKPLVLEPENPVVVGNPKYTTDKDYDLSPLPEAEEEADSVATMVNAKPITGKDATLTKVLTKAKRSNFLYFATHGYADLEKGLAGSFLAFAPDSIYPKGLWTAKNIQNEKFEQAASIAILSACQTGVGKIYDAGFIGIGRAFYKAGIDHTVMSLWSVDDTATKKLMTNFVRTLTTEELYFYPASHLRKAILQFKKDNPDPAHWAPFMLFGFPY